MGLKIEFDRGTLLFKGVMAELDLGALPGVQWDPRVECYRAPARCYASIRAQLDADGVPVDDVVLMPFARLDLQPPTLRPYQAAAIDAWRLAGGRGLICLPTGSGKTYVAVSAIAERGKNALCIVPTRILLEQWRGVLASSMQLEIGCYGDGVREVRPVTVATFESAWRHMHELGNRFDLLVVDEAHHFGAGSRDEALEMSTAAWRLGLTATPPEGLAASTLETLIGPIVFRLSIADLAGKYLSTLEIIELRLDLTIAEREEYEGAWGAFTAVSAHFRELAPGAPWSDFVRWAARSSPGREALAAWHRARRILSLTEAKRKTLGSLLERHRHSRVLVFTADTDAAYRIAQEYLIMPITADIKAPERTEMIAAFQQGRIRALVSARVLNEGFDVPAADVGIVLGGALGEREHVQRVGRLLRPARGKQAVVYELVTRGTAEVSQAKRKRRGLETGRADPL